MIIAYILTLLVGLLMPLQAPINGRLSSLLGHPIWGSFISFCVGTTVLLFVGVVFFRSEWKPSSLEYYKWWHFTGGLIGACLVLSMVILAPQIGILKMMMLLIMGQLVSSAYVDHFGYFGVPVQSFDVVRFIGLVLVILGVGVILYGKSGDRPIKGLIISKQVNKMKD
jgi:bacterial/archaeal transporter family-2 protein